MKKSVAVAVRASVLTQMEHMPTKKSVTTTGEKHWRKLTVLSCLSMNIKEVGIKRLSLYLC